MLAWQQEEGDAKLPYIVIFNTKKPFSRKACTDERIASIRAAFLNQWFVRLLVNGSKDRIYHDFVTL